MSGFSGNGKDLTNRGGTQQVAAGAGTHIALTGAAARFVQTVKTSGVQKTTYDNSGNRYIVAFDATGSRSGTWAKAQQIQGELFALMKYMGIELQIRLSHFGGGVFSALDWSKDAEYLRREMKAVQCVAGGTQIGQVLNDAVKQAGRGKIAALIYTGDAMEESHSDLCGQARKLAQLGIPVFMFQEGDDAAAKRTYQEIAAITHGAYAPFKEGAFNVLKDLFKVVVAVRSNNATLLAAVRNDKNLAGPARALLADLSKK